MCVCIPFSQLGPVYPGKQRQRCFPCGVFLCPDNPLKHLRMTRPSLSHSSSCSIIRNGKILHLFSALFDQIYRSRLLACSLSPLSQSQSEVALYISPDSPNRWTG